MHSHRAVATYYRAALLLGLVPGETVLAWAHDVIEQATEIPPALLDVVVVSPGDLTALRFALQPMCEEHESASVLSALLDLTGRDLTSGRRTTQDTVTVLSQVRRFLTASTEVLEQIDTLVDDFMLAAAGVEGDVAGVEGRVRDWLGTFAGARDALWGPRAFHAVVFQQSMEAAAFVAALSRFLDSPTASAIVGPDESVEVWRAPVSGEDSLLYLTDGALAAAQFAFAPVPVSAVCTHTGAPPGTTRVLDARQQRAMGVEEVARGLGVID